MNLVSVATIGTSADKQHAFLPEYLVVPVESLVLMHRLAGKRLHGGHDHFVIGVD